MKNLKVGDKVRCIDNYTAPLTKGAEYVVTAYDNGTIQVGKCKDWYMTSRFELIEHSHPLPPAVLVQNEREYGLLMHDFQKKGWKWQTGDMPCESVQKYNVLIEIGDNFGWDSLDKSNDYTIIPFSTYALIAGIEVPKEEINIELEYGSVKIRPEFKDIEFNNSSGDIESSIWFTDLDKIIEAYQKLK